MEKSQHTDFNEDKTNESASVACSHVGLWKLDTQEEWRNTSWGLWDERTEKDSACFVDSKENKWGVLNKAEVKRELLDTVKARKLAYYGHTIRKQGNCLEKEILQGTMPGVPRRGRPRTAWIDNIKSWTGLCVEESIGMTEDSTSMVWPTLRSRTAKEQEPTARTGRPYRIHSLRAKVD